MIRRVGILGGMGPQATILVMQKLLDAVPASDDADHIPLIVDQNPQVPSRIRHLFEGNGEDPGPVLAEMARRLAAGGAAALAMPCNTAHHYAKSITSAVNVPFLDMVALSVAHASERVHAGGRVGILASPAVRKVALFDAPLAARQLTAVYPSDEAAMLAAIRRIKAGDTGLQAREVLKAASEELLREGARVQMIACTEFSLIADSVAEGAEAFDTLDILVAAIRDFAFSTGGTEKQPQKRFG
ncbi:amino acid racemase [Tabrizicola sp. J26]|uniref:aspartate/glutamate racemase family protein n=1 Tax=Alitabrizicola rongguiensis TaxID=2909234 RepID=UPI001F21991D|nr:amino acid racemase [Tabrizicola rongguiensis]MCF1709374.1 amino acid racemase [Tabrizicola rongguiensis]